MTENPDPKIVASRYLEAMSRRDFDEFERWLSPDVVFTGPGATLTGAREVTSAYQRLSSALIRNELRRLFVDGNEACIIYDFVTDTAAGAVPTVEWLKIDRGKIRSIWLVTDHVRWPRALEEIGRRAQLSARRS
jgi:ketosteroid isomerase-like protein